MFLLACIIIISVIIQSYIIASKIYVENKKIRFFLINFITIIICIKLYVDICDQYHILTKTDLVFLLIIISLDIYTIFEYKQKLKNAPNKKFVKQAIDNSNAGIMTLKGKSKIIFQNQIMYNIINSLGISDNYVENLKAKSIRKVGEDYIILVDNAAWLIVIGKNEKEITVFNINEEFELNKDLNEKNELIEKNNEKVLWTIEHIEELEKEEKTLKIKNRFHDVLGHNLSILQAYLNQDDLDDKTFDEIKFMIKKMFIDLEDSDSPEENLNNLLKINENLGIKINFTGNLPKNKEIAKLFFEIIREGITNAIKHADSEEIDIEIVESILNTTLKISNDVIIQKDSIIENEGIKGMRRKVKKLGGKLFINPVPRFTIRVEI